MERIESDMGFVTVNAPVFGDTGNSSSTIRLYVDQDGKANANCTRKKNLKVE